MEFPSISSLLVHESDAKYNIHAFEILSLEKQNHYRWRKYVFSFKTINWYRCRRISNDKNKRDENQDMRHFIIVAIPPTLVYNVQSL